MFLCSNSSSVGTHDDINFERHLHYVNMRMLRTSTNFVAPSNSSVSQYPEGLMTIKAIRGVAQVVIVDTLSLNVHTSAN